MTDEDTKFALRKAHLAFRQWRRSRPFWAGVFTLCAALLLLYPPYASLKFGDVVISLHTVGGISALVIGIVLIACASSLWFRPEFRTVAGIVTLVLSLVAIVTANLGSLLIGTTIGVIGAALAIAWSPQPKQQGRRKREARDDSRGQAHGETTRTENDTVSGRAKEPADSVHRGNG